MDGNENENDPIGGWAVNRASGNPSRQVLVRCKVLRAHEEPGIPHIVRLGIRRLRRFLRGRALEAFGDIVPPGNCNRLVWQTLRKTYIVIGPVEVSTLYHIGIPSSTLEDLMKQSTFGDFGAVVIQTWILHHVAHFLNHEACLLSENWTPSEVHDDYGCYVESKYYPGRLQISSDGVYYRTWNTGTLYAMTTSAWAVWRHPEYNPPRRHLDTSESVFAPPTGTHARVRDLEDTPVWTAPVAYAWIRQDTSCKRFVGENDDCSHFSNDSRFSNDSTTSPTTTASATTATTATTTTPLSNDTATAALQSSRESFVHIIGLSDA